MGFYSRYLFPRLMDWGMRSDRFRRERDKTLRDIGGRVLEVGFGSGLNLPHYPETVDGLVTVDVNPGMKHLARRRLQETRLAVEHHIMSGEDLPMEDESFDCAVSTWTLCSIPDVSSALEEVLRVLKPGGTFVFVEHGLSPDPKVARWQQRLTPLQRIVGDGCHLDRDIQGLLVSAGFEIEDIQRYYFEGAPRIMGYFYRGRAIKPEEA